MEAKEQPITTAQEKLHAVSTVFHLFESSAFDSIYWWVNQDINSLMASYKISPGKQVFLSSLMTCTLNNKMYRGRHSKIILWNTTVHTVISCNYTFKLYSCNNFQALGPHHLLREWVSYINYALCKRIFPLIHFKCCCLTAWRAPLPLCGKRRWQHPAPHLHFSWLQWDRDILKPPEK